MANQNNKCVTITHKPGRIDFIECSPQLQPYVDELRLSDVIRIDVNSPVYVDIENPIESNEVKRCLYSLQQMLYQARFNLAVAQLKSYPDFIADGSSQESHLRISTWFLNNAIIKYQSAFDLLLQILWIGNGIYKQIKEYSDVGITTKNLKNILEDCRWMIISNNKEFKEQSYFSQLKSFKEGQIYNKINNTANTLKHRQFINYSELNYKESIAIFSPKYDQTETLYSTINKELISIDKMIDDLKEYHSEFIKLVKQLPFPIK